MLPVVWTEGEMKDAGRSGMSTSGNYAKRGPTETPSVQRNACAAQKSISALLVLKREAEITDRREKGLHLLSFLFTPVSPHIDHPPRHHTRRIRPLKERRGRDPGPN